MMKNTKYVVYLFAIIVLLFILSVSIVILMKGVTSSNAIVEEEDVTLNVNSKVVIIKNILSVSDAFGKTITDDNAGSYAYVDLDIHNNVSEGRNYELFITSSDNEKSVINPSYVKFYLTDDKDVPFSDYSLSKIPTYVDLEYIEDKPSSKVLYSGFLKAYDNQKMILRVWLSDNYVISMDEDKNFTFEIGVRAI